MFSDKLRLLLIFLFLFSCDTVNDLDNLEEIDSFSILSFSSHYDNSQNLLSVFSEISDNTNIEKIELIITSNGNLENGEVVFISELFQSPYNQNIFLYEGQLSLSEEIYIYDIALIFSFNDNSDNLAYFDKISTPIKPNILEWIAPNSFQLDSVNWTFLPIELTISNLNGIDNIETVKYEVQRFYDGCQVDCIFDENCNNPIEDTGYISDLSWNFIHTNSNSSNEIHNYEVNIPMRPINGQGFYDNDGNLVFSETDCGRTGLVLFKFTVKDEDGLTDQVIDIPIEITN